MSWRSDRSASSPSSMINTFVLTHRATAFFCFLIFPTSCLGSSIPSPTPPNECRVVPPMLHAAMPVEAVTATASGAVTNFFRSAAIISLSKTDLPVPVECKMIGLPHELAHQHFP